MSSPCSIPGGVHAIAERTFFSVYGSPTLRRRWHILKRVPAPAATPNLMGGDLVHLVAKHIKTFVELQRKLVGLCIPYLEFPSSFCACRIRAMTARAVETAVSRRRNAFVISFSMEGLAK